MRACRYRSGRHRTGPVSMKALRQLNSSVFLTFRVPFVDVSHLRYITTTPGRPPVASQQTNGTSHPDYLASEASRSSAGRH
ncbi:hypothetical protein EVAR_71477_1 [Eumeta japonica]|uniref:Uncharacterized protein n=1 Tax=Eumeta variegata TaxID=151549 RepID=A0A4C1SIE7_EUMVA|nr:hypothetical protein EVAR_71477_1 [Eumeta japonica]